MGNVRKRVAFSPRTGSIAVVTAQPNTESPKPSRDDEDRQREADVARERTNEDVQEETEDAFDDAEELPQDDAG